MPIAKRANPERELSVKINQWVRENIPNPHMFFAVDRSKKTGLMTHVRQKAAGMVAGVPDTVLLYPGLPAITIELKARGKKPEPGGSQERVGGVIIESGHLWGWCDSVMGYAGLLQQFGVPIRPSGWLHAHNHDLVLEAAAIKREEAGGVPSKKRTYKPNTRKPSAARIRKAEKLRALVRF